MKIRRYDLWDTDACIDAYIEFMSHRSARWEKAAAARRLEGILLSPAFKGFVLEENEGKPAAFVLGFYTYWPGATGFEIVELLTVRDQDSTVAASLALDQLMPLLKEDGVTKVAALSSNFWNSEFYESNAFEENTDVRLFERGL